MGSGGCMGYFFLLVGCFIAFALFVIVHDKIIDRQNSKNYEEEKN
jgi:hypothetical protein